jgi:hypothetical protein
MLIGLVGVENYSAAATPPVTVTTSKQSGQADPTSTSPILFDVVFSEPVTGFVFTDVFYTGSTAGGSLISSVTGGPTSYVVSVSGMTTDGNVSIIIPAAAAASIATGGLSQVSTPGADNVVAWVAPPTAAWHDLFVNSLGIDSNGWLDYCVAQYIAPAAYLAGAPSTGTKIRVTIRTASVGSAGWPMSYVGHVSPTGDVIDFDGTQIAMLWGGSMAGTAGANVSRTCDDMTYAFDKTKGLVVRMTFDAASNIKALDGTGPNYKKSYAADGAHTWPQYTDATPVDDSTWTIPINGIYLIEKVEVYG